MPSKFDNKRTSAQYIAHFNNGRESLSTYYEYPFVDWTASKRTSELKPIGRPTVTQHFGRNAKKITIEGNAISVEKDFFQNIDDANFVEVITDDWEGDVIIDNVQMNRARGEHEVETEAYGTQLAYYYKLECIEKIELPNNNPVKEIYVPQNPNGQSGI